MARVFCGSRVLLESEQIASAFPLPQPPPRRAPPGLFGDVLLLYVVSQTLMLGGRAVLWPANERATGCVSLWTARSSFIACAVLVLAGAVVRRAQLRKLFRWLIWAAATVQPLWLAVPLMACLGAWTTRTRLSGVFVLRLVTGLLGLLGLGLSFPDESALSESCLPIDLAGSALSNHYVVFVSVVVPLALIIGAVYALEVPRLRLVVLGGYGAVLALFWRALGHVVLVAATRPFPLAWSAQLLSAMALLVTAAATARTLAPQHRALSIGSAEEGLGFFVVAGAAALLAHVGIDRDSILFFLVGLAFALLTLGLSVPRLLRLCVDRPLSRDGTPMHALFEWWIPGL